MTVRITDAHLHCTEAADAVEAHGGIAANLYASKAGDRCQPHADPHHLIAVQWIGQKLWTIEDSPPILLRPRDTLAIPAGVNHTTKAVTDSVHFTVRLAPGRDLLVSSLTPDLQGAP